MSAARRPSRVLAADVILDVGTPSRLFLSYHLDAIAVRAKLGRSDLRRRVVAIERRFEKARGNRGLSSPKPLIVVRREV
jgi:hypothetical protein